MKRWPNVATKQLQWRKKERPFKIPEHTHQHSLIGETEPTGRTSTKNIETLLEKQFFPPYMRRVAEIYVATSHSVSRLETIDISKQRTAFT